MGTTSSTTNYTNIINNVIVSTTSTSLQNIGNEVLSSQELTVSCDDINFLKLKGSFMESCMKYWSGIYNDLEPSKMVKFIKQTCSNPMDCSAKHITMSGNINANLSQKQVSDTLISSKSSIDNNINQTSQTTTGLFQFGDKTKNIIDTESTIISKELAQNLQNITTNIGNIQQITVKGNATIRYISMDSVVNTIQKVVQTNNSIINSVNKINNAISQDASSTSLINGVVGKIIIVILIVFGILGVILVILKNFKKKKKNNILLNKTDGEPIKPNNN
jgi:hypothetical protein